MAWRCSTVSCATTTRAEPLSVTADPSPLLYWPMLFVTAGLAVLCAAPILLVLAGFVGVVHFELNMLFIALPALAACAALGVLAHGLLRDLLLPRPVLSADATGILDRRVMTAPLPWTEVSRAVSIAAGRGLVLELRRPIPTFGMGSLIHETPDPGIAYLSLRNLTAPAPALAAGILTLAANAGAETDQAVAHEGVRRRRWSV